MGHGRVFLVGAGPGDPDLMTVKARRLVEGAATLVYDRLIDARVRALFRPSAERIFVGKASGRHTLPQEEINALLIRLARRGGDVVRLKGGDPFVFGRGSEEALALAAEGVPFEVVPGVTAASGCAASAGIPLTHRGLASGVRLITGHARDDGDLALNWASLADAETTLVFYMAAANLPTIRRELIQAGLDPRTPSAVISRGTSAEQRVIFAHLAELPERWAETRLPAPCLVVIGRVVTLASALAPPQAAAVFDELLHA